jgi:hypothetical protein
MPGNGLYLKFDDAIRIDSIPRRYACPSGECVPHNEPKCLCSNSVWYAWGFTLCICSGQVYLPERGKCLVGVELNTTTIGTVKVSVATEFPASIFFGFCVICSPSIDGDRAGQVRDFCNSVGNGQRLLLCASTFNAGVSPNLTPSSRILN